MSGKIIFKKADDFRLGKGERRRAGDGEARLSLRMELEASASRKKCEDEVEKGRKGD